MNEIKLESLLEKHYECTKIVAAEILEEVKINSKDYQELKGNLEVFKKSTYFKAGGILKFSNLFIEIGSILEKEMNDLPLTNRSQL